MTLKAKDIVAGLRRHLEPSRWAFFPEFSARDHMAREDRRLDVYAVSIWPSDHYCRSCFEVKVSRGDWLQEIKTPAKRRLGLLMSNEFWFATPKGLVSPDEVPQEAGLIEVHKDLSCHVIKPAPWRESLPPTWATVAMVARRVQREEQRPMADVAVMAMEQGVRMALVGIFRDDKVIAKVAQLANLKPHEWQQRGEITKQVRDAIEKVALAAGSEWILQNGIFSK